MLRLAFVVGLLSIGSNPVRVAAVEVDSAMLADPVLEPVRQVAVFSPKLRPLWLAALLRPESDLKRQAAEAIAEAAQLGMPELADLIEPLSRQLDAPRTHPAVRLAIARALIALDARGAAELLASRADSDGLDMAQLVEPTLARWDFRPYRDVWLARLEGSTESQRRLLLAIQALGQVRETRGVSGLRQLAMDPSRRADVRLEAAVALSWIGQEDWFDVANQLLETPGDQQLINRLVAARLLTSVKSSHAHPVLLEFAVDPEPAVAALALAAILELDAQMVSELNQQLVENRDAKIRGLTIDLLLAQQTPEAVDLLGSLLSDPHPALRKKACDALVQLAAVDELDIHVRDLVTRMLESSQPEVVRQATLAVGALRHVTASQRLVALVDAPESDVYITAAWSLRRLADPATGPAIMEKIRVESGRRRALVRELAPIVAADPYAEPDFPPVDNSNAQLEQLIQALALMHHDMVEPLLRTFIPKPPRPQLGDPPVLETERQVVLRAAAIWEMGVYHGHTAPPELRPLLSERLVDEHPKHPEHPLVRRMAAVSLGRMKEPSALELLRPWCVPPKAHTELGRACRWAYAQISGEAAAPLPPLSVSHSNWFLSPLER